MVQWQLNVLQSAVNVLLESNACMCSERASKSCDVVQIGFELTFALQRWAEVCMRGVGVFCL